MIIEKKDNAINLKNNYFILGPNAEPSAPEL